MSADIDKKIASIVRKELKNENYDDDCWLKAFKKAGGDENKAKVLYIDIRTNDLKKIAEKEKIAVLFIDKIDDKLIKFKSNKFLNFKQN